LDGEYFFLGRDPGPPGGALAEVFTTFGGIFKSLGEVLKVEGLVPLVSHLFEVAEL
jgi:hypothetical protein